MTSSERFPEDENGKRLAVIEILDANADTDGEVGYRVAGEDFRRFVNANALTPMSVFAGLNNPSNITINITSNVDPAAVAKIVAAALTRAPQS